MNGTIDEDQSVLEDTLPTAWNPSRMSASQLVNILRVLRVKKYVDGVFDKFKARAVFDGRRQKANNPSLESSRLYAVAPRTSCSRPRGVQVVIPRAHVGCRGGLVS